MCSPVQLESALLRLARILVDPAASNDPSSSRASELVPEMQVTIKSGKNMLQFRELTVSLYEETT